MSKAIVLYNSRGGNTEKIAMKIAEGLGADCKSHKQIPDLSSYDLVVIGSWMIFGRLSFAGARYLKKLKRKGIAGKKVAFFFTGGDPEAIHFKTENTDNPIPQKEIMFKSMEKIVGANKGVTILPMNFSCKGAMRMFGKVVENAEHPTEEEFTQAKTFGESLKPQL